MEELKSKIVDALRDVYDPEIPINVYDLGLIYEINIREDNVAMVLMTLTSPACPTAEYLQNIITDAVKSVDGVEEAIVELTFEPPWTPDRISMDAKEELGLGGEEKSSDEIISQNAFSHKHDNLDKITVCFNCGITDSKVPILDCNFKGEKTHICVKCISKF